MKKRWIVGAYPASPTRFGWIPDEEDEFMSGIYQLPNLRGLEVPYSDSIHKYDEEWFLNHVPNELDLVFTLIPGISTRVKADPNFGLASSVESGRAAAVEYVKSAHASLRRAHEVMGRPSVIAVQVHSAPGYQGAGSDPEAFLRSLEELSSLDWQGAQLVLEHVDAGIPDQKAEKGYLSLVDEIDAITRANKNVGICINWGRSTIEARSAQGAINHVTQTKDAGLLAGLIFSGACDLPNRFGPVWKDCHVPPAPLARFTAESGAQELLEPLSLMTSDEIRKTLEAASIDTFDGYMGLKIAPLKDVTIPERIAFVALSLEVLEDAISKVRL